MICRFHPFVLAMASKVWELCVLGSQGQAMSALQQHVVQTMYGAMGHVSWHPPRSAVCILLFSSAYGLVKRDAMPGGLYYILCI
jgi:hypothetical protein